MSSNRKILIISALFPPEPLISAKLTLDIANELSKLNQVLVITPRPSRPYGFNFIMNPNNNYKFKHLILDSYVSPEFSFIGRLFESISFGIKCFNFIRLNYTKFDTIYSSTWPIFAQFFSVFAANRFKIPIIIHIQDVYPESLLTKKIFFKKIIQLILKFFDNYCIKNSKKVIAISNKMKLFLLKNRDVNYKKIEVIENWFNKSEIYNKITQQNIPQGFNYMYLGNIGPLAGLDYIINSFNEVNLPNTKLIIAGNGSMKVKLTEFVKSLNNLNIVFLEVPDGHVESIQELADVLILPLKKNADNTSIPSKLPAYMLSSKPIIACVDINSDIAECILASNSGWVIPSEDNNSLKNVMLEISNTSLSILKKKGKNGYEYASKRFSKEINLAKILKVILE